VAALASIDLEAIGGLDAVASSRLPWYSRSVDSTYLTGKRVFIFGDATHAIAAARIARDELGFTVVGLGTYSREQARDVRDAAALYGVEALVSDDYLEVEAKVAELSPELVLGTQMERHIAKRLGIPCAVISGPFHVQDAPARYSPQMGPEGTNVIFDTWVHPLMMGLEEHLLTMFREDFEFADGTRSHLHERPALADTKAFTMTGVVLDEESGEPVTADVVAVEDMLEEPAPAVPAPARWVAEAERELGKIPFFVRGKARRNTERFAVERGLTLITVDTMYEAKAHFGR
ncbi:MAG: ferredoxin:protochlorophyllide reductase (ATP-dependent) subunit B, partial [Phycisphaerae bacterium]|nr:ferredoxin:protochlorophyllide reductase (ATP-dependent) subunit B [Gemmatimonadaceae bacterium]